MLYFWCYILLKLLPKRRNEMRNKQIKNTLLLCVFSSLIIIICSIGFAGFVNRELTDYSRSSLAELADQQQRSINTQLTSMIYALVGAAETISILGNDIEEQFAYLSSKQDSLGFDYAIISDNNGDAYSNTGQYHNISNETYFTISLAGETFATEIHRSVYLDKDVITVSAPILSENEIIGVLALEYSTDYLKQLLTSHTDESGDSFILTSNGTALISTKDSTEEVGNKETTIYEDGFSYSQLINNFNHGISGSFAYQVDGIQKFGEYRPIVINDWILFFSISEENLTESQQRIGFIMGAVCLVILLLGALNILYVVNTKNRLNKQLEKVAYYDELTGSPNMAKLKLHMKRYLKKNTRGKNYGLVKLDVANFMAINEIYGFEVGNKVLKAITATGTSVKDPKFLQARVGTDEFIFFASDDLIYDLHNNKDDFQTYFKTLVPELKDHDFYFRYGRYYIKDGETDINDMISKVNTAHSTAKKNSSSMVWDYDEKFTIQVLQEAEIANKMRKALDQMEFKLFLQPKVELTSGKITGAEALVRWIDSKGMWIMPDMFIPLFEKNGFILQLDMYMLRLVCEQLKFWKDHGIPAIPISVNFSRLHLHNLNFVSDINALVASYEIDPHYIDIELTETIVSSHENSIKTIFTELQTLGFHVSIDDFGSGYSSLGMLKEFNANTLKLDRSFFLETNDITEEEKGHLVVKSIIDLAKNLGMYIIAEGIETKSQIDFLKGVDCDAVQGYFFSKPLALDDFEDYYSNNR